MYFGSDKFEIRELMLCFFFDERVDFGVGFS